MKNKLITIFLAGVFLFSFTGCSTSGGKNSKKDADLEISVLKAGYGIEWLYEMKNEYEKLNQGIKIYISEESKIERVVAQLKDPDHNTVDLYIQGGNFNRYVDKGKNFVKGYDCVMEPLDEVYLSSIEYGNENSENTIENNMIEHYKDFCKYTHKNGQSHYYQMNWASGIDGIIYNKTLFDEYSLSVPRTTNELISLCGKIKQKNNFSFVFANDTNYWDYMFQIWWAQYQTLAGHADYFNGLVTDSLGNKTRSSDVTEQQGRLESLKVLENLLWHDNGYIDPDFTDYGYTKAQIKFLNGNGLMIVSGDWLQNEMLSIKDQLQNQYEITFMKAPVISSIIDRLETINDDATLAKVIDYVDGNKEDKIGIENVSEKDIKEIEIARNISHTIGTNHSLGIPVYSNAKDLAKDFLKFMYSTKGQQIYIDKTTGSQLPMKYDVKQDSERWSKLSSFQKQRYEMMEKANYVTESSKLMRAGFSSFSPKTEDLEGLFGNVNPKDRMNAEAIFNEIKNYWKGINWQNIIENADL